MRRRQALPALKLHGGLKDPRRPASLMHAYIVVSLMAGVRLEKARAIGWEEDVDLDGNPSVAVGKTRLAGEVARRVAGRFVDGAWLAELAPAGDPAQTVG